MLFDCALDVHEGETVALLGTNGAGKSTLLKSRARTELARSRRGPARGRTITYVDAEYRFGKGIVAGPWRRGGVPRAERRGEPRPVVHRHEGARRRPLRAHRRTCSRSSLPSPNGCACPAGDLSGGQRQQLALARALILEPDVLIIDELSLGLAPIVVQSLIEIVEKLRERGQTMLIVEQSMNIALGALRPSALHGEGPGRVRGDRLGARDSGDLVSTVFFGTRSAVVILADHWAFSIPAQVVVNGPRARARLRGDRRGHRAHLPVVGDHQLRPGRDGRVRRGGVRRPVPAIRPAVPARGRARRRRRVRSSASSPSCSSCVGCSTPRGSCC